MALVLAAGELLHREGLAEGRRLLAAIYGIYAILLWHGWAIFGAASPPPTFLLFWNGPLALLLAPLSGRFFQLALGREDEGPHGWRRYLYRFGPALIGLALVCPWLMLSGEEKLLALEKMLSPQSTLRQAGPGLVFAAAMVYQILLLSAGAWRLRVSLRPQILYRDPRTRLFAILLLLTLLLCLCILIILPQRRLDLTRLAVGASGLLIPILYLAGRRYPHFLSELQAEVKQARYEYSRLGALDLASLQEKLQRLMQEEELYTEEDLSLEGLAERLGATAHQLSEFFNARLGVSFVTYINGFRIQHARQLLLESPSRSILSIAYDSGFAAKSTFNLAFQRHCGLTPTDYRRQHRQKKAGG